MSDIALKLASLQRRLQELQYELDRVRSQQWIAANRVTRDQVICPDDFDEWFGIIDKFVGHLREKGYPRDGKKFAEWNGRLYFISELIAHGMRRDDGIARLDDVT